jgi:hypothetical protein
MPVTNTKERRIKLGSISSNDRAALNLRIFMVFKKFPEYSQDPAIGPYPEPDESGPHHHYIFI